MNKNLFQQKEEMNDIPIYNDRKNNIARYSDCRSKLLNAETIYRLIPTVLAASFIFFHAVKASGCSWKFLPSSLNSNKSCCSINWGCGDFFIFFNDLSWTAFYYLYELRGIGPESSQRKQPLRLIGPHQFRRR